jgi:hypothetical protein|mmetsp:Transcript_20312/g.19620  ORF Transcript_20312/g.19620 Transcript_20312/m.19620 type:complete len:96 (-) Transcript_20312:135-422(-)
MKAPSAVKIRVFGPLLHLPKQLTLTTGTEAGVRKVKVAIVASDPFSRHHLFVQTNIWPQFAVGTTIDFENLIIESKLTSRERNSNDNSILLYKAR